MKVIDTSKLGTGRVVKSDKVYSVRDVLGLLYKNLKPVIDYKPNPALDNSKYVRLARVHGYSNYRLCRYVDIVSLGLENSLPYAHKSLIAQDGAALAIINTLGDMPVSVVFRSLQSKEFMDYSLYPGVYGYDLMQHDFKFGQTIVLTEGVYDADSLRPLYPNVVAIMTSNVSRNQADILKSMTDKFVLAFDSDDAGERGYLISESRFKNVKRLFIYGNDKDLGAIEENRNNPFEFEDRVKYYKQQLGNLIQGSGGIFNG